MERGWTWLRRLGTGQCSFCGAAIDVITIQLLYFILSFVILPLIYYIGDEDQEPGLTQINIKTACSSHRHRRSSLQARVPWLESAAEGVAAGHVDLPRSLQQQWRSH